MEQSLWEANWFPAVREIPCILWNPKVHHRIHKCPPPSPILNQIHLAHAPTSHFLNIHFTIILPSMSEASKWSLSFRFPHQNPVYISPLPQTCYVSRHLILLDFITRTIFGEQYRSLSSSLCSFLHSPVTSPFLDPNIPLSTLFSNTLSLCSSLNVSDQICNGLHDIKNRKEILDQIFEAPCLTEEYNLNIIGYKAPRGVIYPIYTATLTLNNRIIT